MYQHIDTEPPLMSSDEAHKATVDALIEAQRQVSDALHHLVKGKPPMHATPAMRKAVQQLSKAIGTAGTCAALGAIEERQ